MPEGSDILIRVGATIVGVVFVRDAFSAFRGTRLLITKEYSTHVFEGWQSRLVGAFLIVAAIAAFGVAWYGFN